MGVGDMDGYVLHGDGGLICPWVPGSRPSARGGGGRCAQYRSGFMSTFSPGFVVAVGAGHVPTDGSLVW